MRVHLTRASTLKPFSTFLHSNGGEVVRRLKAVGISAEAIVSDETLLPLQQACTFLAESVRREGIDDLGLEAGSRTPIRSMGIFGRMLNNASTLKDILDKLLVWIPAVDSGATAWTESCEQTDSVWLWIRHDFSTARVEADGFALMIMIDAVRIAAGPDWRPAVFSMQSSHPARLARFEALSEAEFRPHNNAVGFSISRKLLGKPVQRLPSSPTTAAPTEDELIRSAPPEDLVDSVACAIRAGLGGLAPTIEQVAGYAGTSPRTLQRNLNEEGTSYRELLDRVRLREARQLLSKATISMAEIFHYLGYSDAANFTHAFRRWTGESPSSFQRNRTRTDGAAMQAML